MFKVWAKKNVEFLAALKSHFPVTGFLVTYLFIPGVHKLPKNLGATSKFQVLEG
jgi:hypothetical protein